MASEVATDWLVLGSWIARVDAEQPRYCRFLREHFRQETVAQAGSAGKPHDAEIRLIHAAAAFDGLPEDRMRVSSPDGGRLLLESPLLRASVLRSAGPVRIEIRLAGQGVSDEVLNLHLCVAIRRVMLWLGFCYLHAGAVVWNGAAALFSGEKGAGKTTVCLRLAKEGAVLLSEDHILVKQADGGTVVSGSDRLARILPDTEAHVFENQPAGDVRDFAGVAKKEFSVGEHFRCSHFRDYRLERIFFLRISDAYECRAISTAAATLRMMTQNRSRFRFSSAGEHQSYLDFFSGLTAGKRIYDITLSRNLDDLGRLVEQFHGA